MAELISYPGTQCPQCRTELGFDIENSRFLCKNGHSFNELPTQFEAKASAPAEAELTSSPEPLGSAIPETASNQPLPQGTAPATEQPGISSAPASNIGMGTVAPSGAFIVERRQSGDVVAAVVVPERHVSACQAEAENQRQSFIEYFQEFVERCLENEWSGSLHRPIARGVEH